MAGRIPGGPGGGRRGGFERPKNARHTFMRVLGYMLRQKWLMFCVLLCIAVSAGAGVFGTYMLKPIINQGILPLIGQPLNSTTLAPLIGMLVLTAAVYLIGALCTFIQQMVMTRVSNRALNGIRRDLFNKLQDLPIRYFDSRTHGDIMSLFTNDVDTLRQALAQGLIQLVTSAVTLVSTFIMMLVLSPLLTLLIVLMLIVMIKMIAVVGKRSASGFMAQQRALGAANGYIEEMIEGQKVVKVFCHEDAVNEHFAQLNENLRQAATQANTYANIIMPLMGNLSYVNYALTAAVGAALAIAGRMDLGTIGSFLQYTRSFSQPVTQISMQFNAILAALAGAERIFAAIDETPELDEGYVTLVNAVISEDGTITESEKRTGQWAWKWPHHDGRLEYVPVRGDVTFEHVDFGYDPEKIVLHDLSLYARPGQKIAFVGSTGAGKTTITNLINRFYEVPDGKIRYDGINITKIKKDDLRRSLGMVLQDTHLFTGTVKENIRYGRLDATDEEIVAAAKLANADFFIRHLPQGYDTVLTADGTNLSQGQRQLLAIARAAVADPSVLILDEATSSIDTRTEKLIEKGMDKLMAGRTVFVIAHRLSTVRNSNAIMVLEHGRIIERGDHDDLLAQKGRYYQLYTGQFELS